MTDAERPEDDPDDVVAALTDPDLVVGLPAGAPAWQARMARFTDGPAHAGRRAEVVALVERWDPAEAGAAARDRTAAVLGSTAGGVVDGMGLARRVPAAVLATALGVADDEVDAVVAAATTVVDAVAPRLTPRPPAGAGAAADAAAAALTGRVGPAGLAVLFQAMDATAALVGNALVAWARGTAPGAAVDHALRHDPPVLLTRRVAATGGPVTVRLGAVAPFGAGPHACPGRDLALALAGGVVAGVAGTGWAPVSGEVTYEDRPNLRLPARVDLGPAGGPGGRIPATRAVPERRAAR